MTVGGTARWCPNAHCRAALPPGVETCPVCGLVLTGPDAERLVEVDRELGALWAEAQQLTRRLLPTAGAAPTGAAPRATAPVRRRSLSGQQLLLGLGAVLTLSAASFFLFVVWDLIGPAGQLLAVSALIAAAVWSSYAACRRRLSAAAETAGVLVAGLTVLVLAAAYGLGWLGLDDLDAGTYGGLAALATAALLLLADRGVPAGEVIRTYRPAAALAFGFAPWLAFPSLVPDDPVPVVLGLLGVALVDAAGAAVALRVDGRRTRVGPPVTAMLLGAGAAAGYALHVLTGWAVGYDADVAVPSRLAVACVLLLGPVAVGLAMLLPGRGHRAAPSATLALAAPSLGIVLTDLPHQALVAVTAVLALVLLGAALDHRPLAPGWRRAGTAFLALAVPVLALLVLGLDAVDENTLFQDPGEASDGPGLLASASVTLLWAVAATAGAVRAHRLVMAAPHEPAGTAAARAAQLVLQVAAAELAWALATTRVLVEVGSAEGWLAGGLLVLAANLLIAAALVRRAHAAPGRALVPVEAELLLAAAAGALVALSAADTRGDGSLAATLIGVGAAVLAYAALPGRLPVAYLGAASVSLGTNVLVEDAGLTAVEATSLPLAALLAGIGVVQARRRAAHPPEARTMLVAGPALSVALGPTLAVAVDRGDEVRLVLVTVAALGVLGVGLWRRWKAPVTAGAAVLVVVAVTQGGPLVSQLPTVLVLGTAGAALLAVGVAWERAVLAGRLVNAWYSALR